MIGQLLMISFLVYGCTTFNLTQEELKIMSNYSSFDCKGMDSCFNYTARFDYIKDTEHIFSEFSCFCDSMCLFFEDCCFDAKPNSSDLKPGLNKSLLELAACKDIKEINALSPLYVIDKCPKSRPDDVTKTLCERTDTVPEEMLLHTPVTGHKTGLLYRNMYCAMCHDTDYLFWKHEIRCRTQIPSSNLTFKEILDLGSCSLQYRAPSPEITYRFCFHNSPIIDQCNPDFNGSNIIELCEDFNGMRLLSGSHGVYKNHFCFACNFEKYEGCGQFYWPSFGIEDKYYSFTMLLDINIGTGTTTAGKKGYSKVTKNITKVLACDADEIFDVFTMTCRTIVCGDLFVLVGRRCVANTSDGSVFDCPRIELDETEYEILEDGDLVELSSGHVHAESEYFMRNTSAFVCSNLTQNNTYTELIDEFVKVPLFFQGEVIVTMSGLSVSLVALCVTIVVYSSFRPLQNIPGKNLLSLSCSLFLAELLMLVGPELAFLKDICRAVAILMHYFFLASFFWMNMMAVDVWVTFSRSFMQAGSHGKTSKRFRLYSLFSWTGPALVVVAALMVEFLASSSTFRPNYGREICWLTNKNAVLIFFAAPLFLITLVNTVLFVATACNIYRSKSSSARQLGSDDSVEIAIYVKLFLVMGLTWVVGFVAVLVPHPVLWYSFIVLNTLQGLFIFLSFVITAKVRQLVRERVFGRQQRPESRTTKSSNVGSSSHAMSEEVSTGTKEPKSTD